MNLIRFPLRLFLIAVCLIYGALEMLLLFPFYTPRRKLRAIQLWSHRVLASCGMKLQTFGSLPAGHHGQMLVCNHISWLDIMAVNAAFPCRFVAKDDVAKWPLIGYLATQARTVYVARNKGSGGNSSKIRNVTQALKDGDTVTLFPEGTSSEGSTILPFKTGFFQAAADAQVPLVPVLCRYPNPDGSSPNPHAAYYGDISLWQSICMVIGQKQSRVELHFLPPVAAAADRQDTARLIRGLLCAKQQELG
ncbi:1-acyl-sn-glycerol-3-phosphate acyltransferase [Kingella potus]|uniref:1-acyl-sn-glycerol-3-phosphate acyltransferase n=1 Tax=Kingella potus TaxID=265175 RepID=A0A377R115_9NEIS|nr:lysophospholipid acyltransferase family protein [Kingella potus]UOP01229.1 1-acyl-sn-glycerol-3-phosphate acyltransferase [Kingella potus]STR00957.1 1-acyl-sn-glycerol-3-phosphate acyltransferase [Kingella potus]